MKIKINLLRIITFTAVITLAFNSLFLTGCKGPVGPVGKQGEPGEPGKNGENGLNAYVIVFDSNGGIPAFSFAVTNHGGTITAPANPSRTAGVPLSEIAVPGLYAGAPETLVPAVSTFTDWYREGESTPFNFAAPITGNITLKAHYTTVSTVSPIGSVPANDIDTALSYVNSNAAAYTLLIDDDIAIAGSDSRVLSASNAKLTLIGIDSERTISLNSAARMFTVGQSGQTGIELTLGNNITLKGHNANNRCVVNVRNAAVFTMLTGSKITGNSSSDTDENGAAVSVNGADFTMQGGTITGNNSTGSSSSGPGGLYGFAANTTITLVGGSVTGNSAVGGSGDVTVLHTIDKFTLSGSASIGNLTLNSDGSTCSALTIEPGWTGSVTGLNLRGNDAVMNTNIGWWLGENVLTGVGVNAASVGRITLGYFLSVTAFDTQPISATHEINTSGVLTVKP